MKVEKYKKGLLKKRKNPLIKFSAGVSEKQKVPTCYIVKRTKQKQKKTC